jgi:hypothetical protein
MDQKNEWKSEAIRDGPINGHFRSEFQAIDVQQPMRTITPAQSVLRPSGQKIPIEFFISGLVLEKVLARIRGLLFDNLVSDLQFFCQLKTVQAGV